jgi:cell division protein FtsW
MNPPATAEQSAEAKPTVKVVDVPYQYLQKQVIGVALAALVCFIASRLNLDYLRRYTWWIGGILAVLLVLVLIPGIGIDVKGSRRWLGIGSLRIQVSEFAKFGLVFCLAHYLALNQTRIGEFKRGFVVPLGIVGVFAGLVVLEPDFGTAALMIAVGLLLLFLAGAKWRYTLPTIALVIGAFGVLVMLNANRLRRLLEFMSEEKSYQLRAALAAFAAGGVDGTGLGKGRQQLTYLPEAHTDFIFSIVGEEMGLWVTLSVVLVFAVMFVAGLVHLRRAPNLFHFLLVTGCLLMICLQAIINLGVVTGVFPTKGMSLPFISAGLSNLLLMGLLLGILLNTQRTWGRVALPNNARSMREVMA